MLYNIRKWVSRVVAAGAAVLLVMAVPEPCAGQAAGLQVFEQVEEAFTRADVSMLLDQAADRLDITLLGASAVYSRAQARYVMGDFFRGYPPERFTFEEQAARNGNGFAAGSYWYTHAPNPFWVYVRIRQSGDQWELREIRIDRRRAD